MDCFYVCMGCLLGTFIGAALLGWFLTNIYEKKINTLTDELIACRGILFLALMPIEEINKNGKIDTVMKDELLHVQTVLADYLYRGIKTEILSPKSNV